MTFKKLVELIASIETMEEYNETCGMIDDSFQHEKITWKDHELLYTLVSKIGDYVCE